MSGLIATFADDRAAEKAYASLGGQIAGGYCLIQSAGRRPGEDEDPESGFMAEKAADDIRDMATMGLYSMNPGDRPDPWDSEFALEYDPPLHGENGPAVPGEDSLRAVVQGDFPGLPDRAVESVSRLTAMMAADSRGRDAVESALDRGGAVIWSRPDPDDWDTVVHILEQEGAEEVIDTNVSKT